MLEQEHPWRDRSRQRRGAAHRDYTIAVSLAIVVFVTARSWVIPLARSAVPPLGRWLAGLTEAGRFLGCGCLALLVVSLLIAAAIGLTRRS